MNLHDLIDCDLGNYGQENPCPKSLTFFDGDYLRHYELGGIYGFVIYGKISERTLFLASIEEDDEHWFAPYNAMQCAAGWHKAIQETYDRMSNWISEHIFIGWAEGVPLLPENYEVRVIKDIPTFETIPFEGEPDNAVLGVKYLNNQ